MGDLSRDFHAHEFACKCGRCPVDGSKVCRILISKLQTIRDVIGKPLTVNSGCRCPEYNAQVKGNRNSFHLEKNGFRAVDIRCLNPHDRLVIVREGLNLGLAVGVHGRFVHLDTRPSPVLFLD